MAASTLRRAWTSLRDDLNPPGAPSFRAHEQVFFVGSALALIGSRYYARMGNYEDHLAHLGWMTTLTERMGQSGQGIEPLLFWALAAVVIRFLAPLGLATVVGRVPRRDIGLRCIQDRGVSAEAAGLMVIGVLAYVLLSQGPSLEHIPFMVSAHAGGTRFWIYEGLMLIQLLATAYLFFGFMLLGMSRILGHHAIIVTALAFALNYGYRPDYEVFLVFFAGLGLSHLTLRGRSVGPTFVVITVVALVRDIIALSGHLDGAPLWQALFSLAGS